MNEQDTGAQTKGLVENQSQIASVNYENPASSGKQRDKLRQVRENGRMHQPN